MNNRLFLLAFLLSTQLLVIGQIDAFTHPFEDTSTTISLYSSPNVYLKELSSDNEAGWMVKIKDKKDAFFCIDIIDLKLYDVWIHRGELGSIIQNYEKKIIPYYSSSNQIIGYINGSHIVRIFDYDDEKVFIQLFIDTISSPIYGWIDKIYLCGDPYTTCN